MDADLEMCILRIVYLNASGAGRHSAHIVDLVTISHG